MSDKVISQKVFDDVVRENITEFDMDIEEAIVDAIDQFNKQSISLKFILPDLLKFEVEGENHHPLLLSIKQFHKFVEKNEFDKSFQDETKSILLDISNQCDQGLAHRMLANQHGLLNDLRISLVQLRFKQLDHWIILYAFSSFIRGQGDVVNDKIDLLPTIIEANGLQEKIIENKSIFDNVLVETLSQCFRFICACCTMNEPYRRFAFNDTDLRIIICNCVKFMSELLPELVENNNLSPQLLELVDELMSVIRCFIVDDDMRVDFSSAHDRARAIVQSENCIIKLLKMAQTLKYDQHQKFISEIFFTLSDLSVRNEFCQQILDQGGLNYVISIFESNYQSKKIANSASSLLKSLCGNDNVKHTLTKHKISLGVLLNAIQYHSNIDSVVYNSASALSAACLRTPDSSRILVQEFDAASILTQSLQAHKSHADIFKQLCRCIRNMVGRAPELSDAFINCGVESLLNEPGLRLCEDEAKSALRDLSLKVNFKEPWTGTGFKLDE